jgi:alkaline phosphatase
MPSHPFRKEIRMFSSRTLTRLAAVATLFAAGQVGLAAGPAKNVILMISDGQGFNHVRATDLYTGVTPAYQGADFLKIGMQTYSASGNANAPYDSAQMFNGTDATFAMSNYTDSASAATAMYCGQKIWDGDINMTAEANQKPLQSFFELAAMDPYGKSMGAVSSVQMTHATPAAVYGHNVSRNNYAELGSEGVYGSNPSVNNGFYDALNYNGNFKVLMGAGHGAFDNSGNGDESVNDKYAGGTATFEDIRDGAAPNGWTFVEDKADFQSIAAGGIGAAPDKLLGIAQANSTIQQSRSGLVADPSNPSGMAYNPLTPTLQTMTTAALNVLGKNSKGFTVMIEGGAVDWAGHANDIGRMIEEQIDFNNSVQAAIDWVEANSNWDETLLIVTADHETGNLWGSGSYTDDNTDGNYDPGTDTFNGYQQIDATGSDVLTSVQWLSGNHTNALVPLYAKGAGSNLFNNFVVGQEDIAAHYGAGTAGFGNGMVDYIDNTAIFNVMMDATGVPEPATMTVLALGGIALIRRRRSA